MENQTNSKSLILNYGLLLGLVSLIPSLIKYAMGDYLENDIMSMVLSTIITVTFIVLGLKKYKESNGGFLSWGESVKIGMGMVLVSLIITIAYLIIFTTMIEPTFKEQVIELTQQKWVEAGMTEEMIEQQLPYVRDYFSLSLYGSIVIMALFFGFVISAIVGAIMKKSEEDQY